MKKLSMILVLLFSAFFITNDTLASNKLPRLKSFKKPLKKKPLKVLCRKVWSVGHSYCPLNSNHPGASYASSIISVETCQENGVVQCSETVVSPIRGAYNYCNDSGF